MSLSRFVALALSLFASLGLFAQSPTLDVFVQPSLLVVDAGASATFETSIVNPDNARATDVRIVYSIEGEATFLHLDGHQNWNCTVAPKRTECTRATTFSVPDTFRVTIQAGAANGGTSTLTMTATAAQPVIGQNVASATLQSFQAIAVETTADAGPGSLRAAIEMANASDKPSKIEFRLPAPVPSEGWFTILPESPLPPIIAERVMIDGRSQTRFTGDTNQRGPEIAIDGRRAHRGLEIHSPCLARVEGLAIGNFDENQGLWFTKSRQCANPVSFGIDVRLVMDNYIGTDPTGLVAWPNKRGLRGDFGSGHIRNNLISGNTYSGMWIWVTEGRFDSFLIEENRIGVASDGSPLPNGAAGILFGDRVSADVRRNLIANHPGMGIALVRGETYVGIHQNSMRDNGGIAIDWGIDGVSPRRESDRESDPNAPVLLSGFYSAATNRTYFNVTSKTVRPGADGINVDLDFYANRGPDGDGEEWIGTGVVTDIEGGAYMTSVAGDHRGKWINATLTRTPLFFLRGPGTEGATFGDDSTSELSNAIHVE